MNVLEVHVSLLCSVFSFQRIYRGNQMIKKLCCGVKNQNWVWLILDDYIIASVFCISDPLHQARGIFVCEERLSLLASACVCSAMDCFQEKMSFLFLTILFIYFFTQRGRVGEREGEKHPCVVASRASPTGDLACNPGMSPDWESNLGPFGSRASSVQSTELQQPGQKKSLFIIATS